MIYMMLFVKSEDVVDVIISQIFTDINYISYMYSILKTIESGSILITYSNLINKKISFLGIFSFI